MNDCTELDQTGAAVTSVERPVRVLPGRERSDWPWGELYRQPAVLVLRKCLICLTEQPDQV